MRLHVLPTLGRRRLADLGPRDVKRLAADLRSKGLSENSVRLALAPLRAMLADAFEDEVIRRNPAAGVSVSKPRDDFDEGGGEAKVKALTDDELRRLLAEIPEAHRLLFELLAVSGLRIGEALALQWQHVDFGRRRLLVRRRWYRGTFAAPKSRFGRRDVPLTEAMTRRLWAARKEARGSDEALVFPSAAGTPLGDANLYKIFKPAAKRAGVPWAAFHTLRHTCATALFRAGKNPKQVQAWLGHHAASFTLDTYVHLIEDDVAEAPAALDALVSGATGRNRTRLNRPSRSAT
jgi:integrase